MNNLFQEYPWSINGPYLDDILILYEYQDLHDHHIRVVLDLLLQNQLYSTPEK